MGLKLIKQYPLVLVFLLALGVRLVAYYLFNYIVLEGQFLHPDSELYHIASVQRMESWKSLSPDLVGYPSYVNLISPL